MDYDEWLLNELAKTQADIMELDNLIDRLQRFREDLHHHLLKTREEHTGTVRAMREAIYDQHHKDG